MTYPAEGTQYAHPDSPAGRAEAEADVMAEADRRERASVQPMIDRVDEILNAPLPEQLDTAELVSIIKALRQDYAHEVEMHDRHLKRDMERIAEVEARIRTVQAGHLHVQRSRAEILETVKQLQMNVRDAATDLLNLVEGEQ